MKNLIVLFAISSLLAFSNTLLAAEISSSSTSGSISDANFKILQQQILQANLKSEAQIKQLQANLQKEIDTLNSQLQTKIQQIQSQMQQQTQQLQQQINKLGAVKGK